MSKTKKLLIALMLLIAVLLLPNMVNAATVEATETTLTSTGVEVKWKYQLEDNCITNLKTTNVASSISGTLTIPSTIDGYNVIEIGSYAFEDCTGLTSVTIPSGITSIGTHAFDGCTGLTSITLPNTLTNIGSYAFYNCSGITNITIPDTVTSLGSCAFWKCSGMTSVTLSKNISMIDSYTFWNCDGLTEIELPNNLTTIANNAFDDCTYLRFIKMPEVTVSIANNAFEDCGELTIYGVVGSVAETYAQNNNINFENIENWGNRNQNAGADITAPTVSKMQIKYSSVMDYYNTTTNDFRLPKNAEITIVVEFSETLTGTTTPTLTIKCGTGNNIELNNGTISGKNIVYTYAIKESDEGLITVVSLTGGNVTDAAENDAVLSTKELKVEYNSNYAYAEGAKSTTDGSQQETVDTTTYVSFPFIIYNGKGSVDLKSGVDIENYKMYYQFVEISEEVYNKITDLQDKYKNGEITYEEYFVQYNEVVTKYNNKNWVETKDGNFNLDLSKFTGTKKFALWVKLEMEDKTVYESQVYKMNGSGTATNEPDATQKPTTTDKDTTKDNTTAKDKLPNTGRVLLFWIIGIVAVSGIVARIRYKKLYM